MFGTINLFVRCTEGHYVELHAICKAVERSTVRKRIKTLHIESDGRSIKLIPHQNTVSVREGDSLIIYLADNASVYEVDHELVLCDIITYGKDMCLHESKPNLWLARKLHSLVHPVEQADGTIVADDDKNEIALGSCETQIRQAIYAGNIVTGSLDWLRMENMV